MGHMPWKLGVLHSAYSSVATISSASRATNTRKQLFHYTILGIIMKKKKQKTN